jgi:hypothetical protein
MDPFFLYVSIGALVLLIISLAVIGVMLTKMNSYSVFPPTQNACPDHWDVSSNPNYCGAPLMPAGRNKGRMALGGTGSGILTENGDNIGMCNGTTFGCKPAGAGTILDVQPAGSGSVQNFQYVHLGSTNPNWNSETGLYPGKTTLCAQHAWANMMGISWDGVKNYNGC